MASENQIVNGRNSGIILSINRGERALLVGRTGTGKSTLGRCLLAKCRQFIVIIDPKGDFDYGDFPVISDPEELSYVQRSKKVKGVIYRPSPEFWSSETWDDVFKWIYLFRDCCLYIDEIFGVGHKGQFPHWLRACLTRGRSLHITCIACTQRPASIPMELLTESERRYMFGLDKLDDKKRMAELMCGDRLVKGREVPTVLQPMKGYHNFYFYNVKSAEPTREYVLQLTTVPAQRENT